MGEHPKGLDEEEVQDGRQAEGAEREGHGTEGEDGREAARRREGGAPGTGRSHRP
ncbi:hypothetical protein ACH473_10725 [Cellulosimicrobium funkei]|uniref:hypothetical protein n=1 Tax=Cellulosimicrobium funkei TaxID=264251 RepID=UPI00379277C9